MDPLECCLVLCAKIEGDSKKSCICDSELPHCPKFELDSVLVAHFASQHPEVDLICWSQTFNFIDPHVVPTIPTMYLQDASIQCDHVFE